MAVNLDRYAEVLTIIRGEGKPAISVPRLSGLLGVKASTLNARFRRRQVQVSTVGRVNFVPVEVAVELTAVHKYALLGWPTLEHASQATGVKGCTLKAKCEKGQVEGHLDLTKRLRVNPDALNRLRPACSKENGKPREQRPMTTQFGPAKAEISRRRSIQSKEARLASAAARAHLLLMARDAGTNVGMAKPFVLPPARGVEVGLVTAKDYGLSEPLPASQKDRPNGSAVSRKQPGCLCYDPDRPFSLSECAVGKPIRYGEYAGTIVGLLDEPFSPKIRVRFPEHRHPLMQEVLLVVEKRRN